MTTNNLYDGAKLRIEIYRLAWCRYSKRFKRNTAACMLKLLWKLAKYAAAPWHRLAFVSCGKLHFWPALAGLWTNLLQNASYTDEYFASIHQIYLLFAWDKSIYLSSCLYTGCQKCIENFWDGGDWAINSAVWAKCVVSLYLYFQYCNRPSSSPSVACLARRI